MKKILLWALLLIIIPPVFTNCSKKEKEEDEKKDYWKEYADWRDENVLFYEEKYAETDASGNLVYERITPSWDPDATVLMRWYNDRSLTQDAMSPFSTSYIDVIYKGTTYQDTIFDSSYNNTQYGDSIARFKLSNNIKGWVIALTEMHVGDHCEIIIPYDCGYGNNYKSEILLPYSTLVFDVKLCGIPGLEKPVYGKKTE